MKKTLTINLGGIVFHIDEDAYQLLKKYLDNLNVYFEHQEGCSEITEDIEGRFAELLSERVLQENQAVTIKDIEEIISQIGQPEEIASVDEDINEGKPHEEPRGEEMFTQKPRKKIFLNPDDKIIGGVAGGLAVY